ncbi:MAG TPA: hypothetical protein PKV75_12455 [Desulfobacterales bacterium]|nr:hypothetical protein [Desulfobacterales bacterium]
MIKKKHRELRDLFNPFVTLMMAAFSILLFIDLLNSDAITEELLDYGIDCFALTSFVIAWVTVNPVPFPDEFKSPNQRTIFLKTILSFVLPLALAIIVAAILNFFPL